MTIKIFITLFVLYTIFKLILRFKNGELTLLWFLGWCMVWFGVLIVTLLPQTSDWLAAYLGFNRQGVDVIMYFVVLMLVYAAFRLTLKIEHLEYEITQVVRSKALEDLRK